MSAFAMHRSPRVQYASGVTEHSPIGPPWTAIELTSVTAATMPSIHSTGRATRRVPPRRMTAITIGHSR